MKLKRWAFVLALLGVAIAVRVFWSLGPKEPSYDGRSLSAWLDEWGQAYNDRTNHATIAIRAIGSNALPILLSRLSKEEPREERNLWRVVDQVLPNLDPMNREINRAVTAAEAINLLGVEAKPAFPTLTNLFSSRSHCLTAAIGLAGIGHEGVAVLLEALTNQDWVHRHSAATALGEARSDFDKVIPVLLEVVKIQGHKKEGYLVRGAAGSALVQLHQEPHLVVPVFSEFLTNPDANMRCFGASLLAGFGADAKAAVPLLLKERTDADLDVRESAERALKEIDPEAAGKIGLK
jgi:HEAT repeat protein